MHILLKHLFIAIPSIVFIQLMIYVLYLDRRSWTNRLLAIVLLIDIITNLSAYFFLITNDFHAVQFSSGLIKPVWTLIFPVYTHFLFTITEHQILKKRWPILLLYAFNIPNFIAPVLYKSNALFLWGWSTQGFHNSFFLWYIRISPFFYAAVSAYALLTSQKATANYRIQKQTSLILRSFYATAILVFLPWQFSVIFDKESFPLWENFASMIVLSTNVYGISRYRLQSLKTSRILSDMIENASEFILMLSIEGFIFSVNKNVAGFWGYKKHELEGNSISTILLDDAELNAELKKMQIRPSYSPRVDLTVRAQNNHYITVKTGVHAIRNQFDEVIGYYLIFYGLSNEMQQFDQLQINYDLTAREKEIALLLTKGMSNQEIADTLFISLATVKTHTHNIYRKTATKNKSELRNIIS